MKITTKENSKSKPPTTRELPIIGCEIAKVTWRVVGAGIEDLSHGTFLALGGWYLAIFLTANAFAQGSLTPPGAPAPTMKTLNQIEARMPISSAPFTITQPGSYYLTTNVSVSGGNAITIATNGVTLDLNGFTISSTAASASGFGILLESGLQNIAILNGFIQGGVTNNGSGTYSGSGFGYGINFSGTQPVNVRVSGICVSGCLVHGIALATGNSTIVESSTVRTAGSYGIAASTVKSSVAIDCGYTAIYGDQVSDCHGACSGTGNGITAFAACNCYGESAETGTGVYATYSAQNCYGLNQGSGGGVYAGAAQNCYGDSAGGDGVTAWTALNCTGLSEGSGYGIRAYDAAMNCFGSSTAGTALDAQCASFCTAYRLGGTAIHAAVANGCFALTGTNSIIYKYNMP